MPDSDAGHPSSRTLEHPFLASLGVLLRLANQYWVQEVEAALRDAGFGDLRPHHANVFTFVPADGIQVSELTRLARVRKQSMAQTVDELERMGYVERHPDPSDRRARLVFLTDRGTRVRPLAMEAGHGVEARWAKLTSPEHVAALRQSLLEVVSGMSRAAEEESAAEP